MIKKSLAIFGIAAAAFAQAQDITSVKNAYEVYGTTVPGTSKYNAMAGATGAMGSDISSIHNNPAGIGVAIASEISGTFMNIQNTNTTTLFGTANDYKVRANDINQVGGLMAFDINSNSPWKFVNLGVNFSGKSVEDYSESQGNNSINFDLGSDGVSFRRHAYDRTGYVTKTSIGIGGNYDNRFYIGTAVNVHGAQIHQSDAAEMAYTTDGATESFFKQYTPYSEDSNGFSASLGVIGRINNQFRLGAAIETPTYWKIDRTYTYYDAQSSDNDGEYSEVRHLNTPAKATLSAAFIPNKNFAVNVDYAIALNKPKYTAGDAAVTQEFRDFYNGYGNQSELKVGAEYRILGIRLRGGYAFANNPFGSINIKSLSSANVGSDQTYSDLFAGKRNTIGAGLGYDFKSFYIDAAYQNVSSTYSNPFLRGSSSAGSQYYSSNAFFANDAAVVSNVKNVKNNVSVTLGWKF